MKTLFFTHEPWEREYVTRQAPVTGTEVIFVEGPLRADQVLPEAAEAEIISIFVNSRIDEQALAVFPKLKLIATRSTGFDHVDLEACRKRGIAVVNVPSYGEHTVAEYTFALILSLSRKICVAYERVREKGSFSSEGLRGFDLAEKTLGVVGTGRIGKNVIRAARGFGMRVAAYDVYADETYAAELGISYLPLPELLGMSDIVTLHVPYTQSTHHLINADTLRAMKKGAYLINTSRGAVVDTEELVRALKEGRLGGAALDVLEEENAYEDEAAFLIAGDADAEELRTVLANHVLIDMPNVIITPHVAYNTWEGVRRILETTSQNISKFIAGDPQYIIS